MQEATEKNLRDAFAGESQAHMKYMAFADQAERERLANVARFFRAASYSEQQHATNHLRALSGVGKTAQNLEAALGGETFEITTMYPEYVRWPDRRARRRLRQHGGRPGCREGPCGNLRPGQRGIAGGKDVELDKVWVCEHCGYTMEGEPRPLPCLQHSKEQIPQF
jgi:rubrerythrin